MNKHTPAPWIVEGRVTGNGFDRTAVVANTLIAEIYSTKFKGIENEIANAHLIAAAPELLEALESVVLNWVHLNDEHFEGVAGRLKGMCEEAINKARGIK